MTKKRQFDPTDMDDPRYDPARDPTHPFYEEDSAEAEQESDSSDDGAYKVGPGRPPKQYTWKKDGPSPNPKGRPKKVPSMEPDLKKAFEDALNGHEGREEDRADQGHPRHSAAHQPVRQG
jgi:hypothetical protein